MKIVPVRKSGFGTASSPSAPLRRGGGCVTAVGARLRWLCAASTLVFALSGCGDSEPTRVAADPPTAVATQDSETSIVAARLSELVLDLMLDRGAVPLRLPEQEIGRVVPRSQHLDQLVPGDYAVPLSDFASESCGALRGMVRVLCYEAVVNEIEITVLTGPLPRREIAGEIQRRCLAAGVALSVDVEEPPTSLGLVPEGWVPFGRALSIYLLPDAVLIHLGYVSTK